MAPCVTADLMPSFLHIANLLPRHTSAMFSAVHSHDVTYNPKGAFQTSFLQFWSHERIMLKQSVIVFEADCCLSVSEISADFNFLRCCGYNQQQRDKN